MRTSNGNIARNDRAQFYYKNKKGNFIQPSLQFYSFIVLKNPLQRNSVKALCVKTYIFTGVTAVLPDLEWPFVPSTPNQQSIYLFDVNMADNPRFTDV